VTAARAWSLKNRDNSDYWIRQISASWVTVHRHSFPGGPPLTHRVRPALGSGWGFGHRPFIQPSPF